MTATCSVIHGPAFSGADVRVACAKRLVLLQALSPTPFSCALGYLGRSLQRYLLGGREDRILINHFAVASSLAIWRHLSRFPLEPAAQPRIDDTASIIHETACQICSYVQSEAIPNLLRGEPKPRDPRALCGSALCLNSTLVL